MAVDGRKDARVAFRPVNGISFIFVFTLLLIVAVDPVLRLVLAQSKVLARCPRPPGRILELCEGALDYMLKVADRRKETSSRAVKGTWPSCRGLFSASFLLSLSPLTSYLPWWIWNRHHGLPVSPTTLSTAAESKNCLVSTQHIFVQFRVPCRKFQNINAFID